ncbi:L,D-transpeptidase family protein [Streptomyces sp. N2-109]|uniref:L,D-transpeptidase family protein n=1 Tax=Streptomyces gossypii TaxID=2883101 RepID=A0ABT2JUA0_9ACTN|nr:L,D-transpeptidase family protein [Streptomyces gossypii]MCT2591457.1 L,D-transpeptidase family protein [Streptomyces gossypii]
MAPATVVALTLLLTGCGGDSPPKDDGAASSPSSSPSASRSPAPAGHTGLKRIPGVGDRLQEKIPDRSRQVVAVYGKGEDSGEAKIELYTRKDPEKVSGGDASGRWSRDKQWSGHNGKRGWTTDHREGDKRSPVGVFTLTDAGGVLPDPGARLPYTHSSAFTPPSYWPEKTRHDFDLVIAIDYNRVEGTSPLDPTRPEGRTKGGSIWLHMDHGSGTSGCVSLSRSGMEYLLRTLDPAAHPVVVMGDRATLGK